MRIGKLLISILWLFFTAIPLVYATTSTEPSVYTEDKLSILVSKDQPRFIIRLKANPTTGYNWFLREYDARLITPLKHTFEAAKTKQVGAPGYDIWTFEIKPAALIVPQITQVRFIYTRPWETAGQETQVVFRISTQ